MNIAIIGSGISGLTAAYMLNKQHNVIVFESADRIGGHTATKQVTVNRKVCEVDTGFIVFNDWTYPTFIKLLETLGVVSQPTAMSFSVFNKGSGLEYGGKNINALFAQRRNIFNVNHYRMLRDIIRFNKEAIIDLDAGHLEETTTLGQYLSDRNYSKQFINYYLIPMGSAIWSSTREDMLNSPLLFFVRFFKNHGLLSIKNRPQWRVVKGGSKEYLKPLTQSFTNKIHLNTKISHVTRSKDDCILTFAGGSSMAFDQVVFACHSDQALTLIADPSEEEENILSRIPYSLNQVTLHTDATLLPKSKRAWSAWNYLLNTGNSTPPILSYNMNILQGIQSDLPIVVTLNAEEKINPANILGSFKYSHPIFSLDTQAAQQRWSEINGVNRTWFCGAYWQNGFHEDGCASGQRVATALGVASL